jgi:hypothetical protein
MIPLYSPKNDLELLLMKSLLQNARIYYFVQNENFSTQYIGVKVDGYNKATIFVEEDRYEEAKKIIEEAINNQIRFKLSFLDKLRLVFEFILTGWFIPGRCNKKMKDEQDEEK